MNGLELRICSALGAVDVVVIGSQGIAFEALYPDHNALPNDRKEPVAH